MSSDSSCSTINPDDFMVFGYYITIITDEDLSFGDNVKYIQSEDKTVFTKFSHEEWRDEKYKMAGKAMHPSKKGTPVNLLISGVIAPKGEYGDIITEEEREKLVYVFASVKFDSSQSLINSHKINKGDSI